MANIKPSFDSNKMTDPVYSTRTEADAVAAIAQSAVTPLEVETGNIYWAHTGNGDMATLDLQGDEYREQAGLPPLWVCGTFRFFQLDGFIDYINNHVHPENRAEIWADCAHNTITAVLNGHSRNASGDLNQHPGWGDHRAILQFQLTSAWADWSKFCEQSHPQSEFADFLEDHLSDVVEPDAAHLLEIASSLSISSGVQFKQATRLATGEVSFQYTEEHTATGGRQNLLKIPKAVTLALAPFEGSAAFRVPARFRYSLREGKLGLRLLLDRPDQILRSSIDDACKGIAAATQLTVYHGIPAGPL
jgi:uncharacterized protein YfdQ (DUF2303 family)